MPSLRAKRVGIVRVLTVCNYCRPQRRIVTKEQTSAKIGCESRHELSRQNSLDWITPSRSSGCMFLLTLACESTIYGLYKQRKSWRQSFSQIAQQRRTLKLLYIASPFSNFPMRSTFEAALHSLVTFPMRSTFVISTWFLEKTHKRDVGAPGGSPGAISQSHLNVM